MTKTDEEVVAAPVVPEGANPEEFLNDEALAKWHMARHDALDADDPSKAEAAQAVRRAKLAAAITAAVDPDAV